MGDALDPEAVRHGRWMIALGLLLLIVGAVLTTLPTERGWGYYFGSPQQNSLLLMGLGALCVLVGAMNLHGGLRDEGTAAPSRVA